MKVLPMMSRGVVFVREDETVELAPMQVWHTRSGTHVRIGRNVYFFNPDGSYDGSEHKVHADKRRELEEALRQSGDNKGLAPEEPYHPDGSPGHREETAAWPFARHQPGGKSYLVRGKKPS